MAQERKKELENVKNSLKDLSVSFLAECSDEELFDLRTALDFTSNLISSLVKIRFHHRTHFSKIVKD